ncbi:MAG: flagellar type III secretion system pore protein FliP [Brachyspira sp.]|jgi:flagellar biosynthetic protein fliP|nr:flagellar type III secretion system pore protein FliP [Brachyspira sp.]CCY23992.1 flagellar biosynthetic protein FliP [Brachyspira sp. CAG:484]
MDNVLKDINPVLQILIVMTVFSLLPFVFCCMTSFLRFVIVFSMLKTAMGTQQVPPSIVIIGLSMILTFYTMGPTFQKMYEMGSIPYQQNQNIVAAIDQGSKPLKEFMMKQTRETDLAFFVELTNKVPPKSPDEITVWQVAPAFIMSELKTAFEIGFIIFVPFIVLDLVVANILLALGMFMLSPTIISLPFKLLIFIAVDGWALIVQGLVTSYNQ